MPVTVTAIPCPPTHPDVLQQLLALERRTFGKAGWEAPELSKELSKRTTLLLLASVDEEEEDVSQPQEEEEWEAGHNWHPTAATSSSKQQQPRQGGKPPPRDQRSGGGKGGGTAAASAPASSKGAPAAAAASAPGPAGYILGSTTSLNVHVVRLAVRAEHRRKGLGRALVQGLLSAALTQRRCMSASLYVAEDNTAARALYDWLGFQEDAHLIDYYAPGKHALRLACDLQGNARLQAAGSGTGPR